MVTSASHEAVVSWDEPPLGRAFVHEVGSFYRRVAGRRWLCLVFALLLGAAEGVLTYLVRPGVEGWVVLKVVENRNREGEGARNNLELRQYLRDGVFSRQALREALKADPEWSVRAATVSPEELDEMREEIGIDIQGNTFIEDHHPGDPPRSMRLRVSWRAADGNVSQKMAELLVQLLTKSEVARLKEDDLRARGAAQAALEEAQRGVDRLLEERRTLEQVPHPPAVAVYALGRQLQAAGERLDRARAALVGTSLSRRADTEEPWLFTVLDRRPPWNPPSVFSRALFLAIVTTVGCYPVLLLLMGAFSWRLSRALDAEELGFAVLGVVPGHSALVSPVEGASERIKR